MPQRYSFNDIVRILRSQGWEFHHYTGSHANYRKPGYPTVVVPYMRGVLRPGTVASIRRQMLLTSEEFERIVDEVL